MRNLVFIWTCVMFVIPCQAGIIYVDADANGADDGSSWTDAYNYLQDALADANSDPNVDEIWVAQGVYKPDANPADPNGSGDRTATFQLINDVALKGGYAGFGEPDPNARAIEAYETILSGDLNGDDVGFTNNRENSYNVVTGSGTNPNTVLDGFTIMGGNANGDSSPNLYGGGMFNWNNNATLANCTFVGNSARRYGGGMYNYKGNATVTNCTFTGNRASWFCGGMFNKNNNATVTNCTFTENSGGGLANANSNSTVTNCTFIGNSDLTGGGMYNDYGDANIIDCTFTGNSATLGGGMYNFKGNATVTNCTFSSNSATNGGGMYNRGKTTLTSCTFTGNRADVETGGGMHNDGNATLTNCTFSGNSALFGGGMHNHGNATLTNCSFSGNSADQGLGGGMCNDSGKTTPTNCTFSRNSALSGGGMYNYESRATLTNCILWGNTASEYGPELFLTSNSTLSIGYSDIEHGKLGVYVEPSGQLYWGPANISDDPIFVDANGTDDILGTEDDNLRLLEGSLCIDAGDPNYIPKPNETDLDGNPRIVNDRIDMGAYEYVPPIAAELDINPKTLNLKSKGNPITCRIRLPEDYNVADIDPNSIFLEHQIPADRVWLQEEFAVAKFSRPALQELLADLQTPAEAELLVTGQLTDGTIFEGTDTIRVINKGRKEQISSNVNPGDHSGHHRPYRLIRP